MPREQNGADVAAVGVPSASERVTALSRRHFLHGAAAGAIVPLVAPAHAGAVAPAHVALPTDGRVRRRRKKRSAGLLPDPDEVGRRVGNPADLEIVEAASLLQAHRLSSRELTAACLARVSRRDELLTAWARVYEDLAERLARRADRRLSRTGVRRHGPAPLLAGVPIGLKDLFAVEGRPLTAGSRVLEDNVATGDSTVWARLERHGMVLLGHTRTFEFASAAAPPPSRNPWDLSRSPGASSAGSGAALAARMVPAATGSDTAGSLRDPAAANGISTIKPTYGLVSSFGVIPLAWSWDQAGPMARSVRDCSLLLSAMAGRDSHDAATLAPPPPPELYPLAARRRQRPLAALRIGVPRDFGAPLTPGIASVFERVQRELRGLGARLVSLDASFDDSAVQPAFNAEILAYHQQFFPEKADLYFPGNRARLQGIAETLTSAVGYLDVQRERTRLTHEWLGIFHRHRLDALLTPLRLGETPQVDVPGRPLGGLTRMWNTTGFPVVGMPSGLSPQTRLPVGAQLVGLPHSERLILQAAIDYQAEHPYHRLRPPRYD